MDGRSEFVVVFVVVGGIAAVAVEGINVCVVVVDDDGIGIIPVVPESVVVADVGSGCIDVCGGSVFVGVAADVLIDPFVVDAVGIMVALALA